MTTVEWLIVQLRATKCYEVHCTHLLWRVRNENIKLFDYPKISIDVLGLSA